MNAVRENANIVIIGRQFVSSKGVSSLHFHDKFEICKITSESSSFLVDGKIVKAKRGDIVFIDENAFHQFIVDLPTVEMKLVQFTADVVSDGKVPIVPIRVHIPHEEIAAIPHLEEDVDFLFDLLIREGRVENAAGENLLAKSVASALYQLLVRHFSEEQRDAQKDITRFQEVISYIKNHYTEDLTVGVLAEKVFMSRTQLYYLFSKHSNLGVGEYINSMRISRVNSMLLQNVPITTAALESGFKSVRTFNYVYRRYMGMTPSEYLESVAQKERGRGKNE